MNAGFSYGARRVTNATAVLVYITIERERKSVREMAKGILEVQLVGAKGLANTEILGKMDPYVVIGYKSQERKSSVAQGQGSNPVWNETFKFLVHSSGATDSQNKLTLRIMDKDTFTADDFVGEAVVNVSDLILLGMEDGSAEQRPTKYSVVLADRTYCGEIRLGLKFTPQIDEENLDEELGGWKDSFHY